MCSIPPAQILGTATALAARAAGSPRPRDADPLSHGVAVAGHDLADNLVARHDTGPVGRQVAAHHVAVGSAHAARPHADEQLTGTWFGAFGQHTGTAGPSHPHDHEGCPRTTATGQVTWWSTA